MPRPLSMLLPARERVNLKDIVAFYEIQNFVGKHRERIMNGSQRDVRYAVTFAAYACYRSSKIFEADALFLGYVTVEVGTGEYVFNIHGISHFKKLMKRVKNDITTFKNFADGTIEKILVNKSQSLAELARRTESQANIANEAVYDLAHSLLISPYEFTKTQ